MKTLKLTSFALAAAMMIGAAGSIATPSNAEAGRLTIHFGGHGHYHGHVYRPHYGSPYRACRWLKRKARYTGSRYWWKRYRRCIRAYY
ncbi:MAG: hypothetical protein AAF468_09560 [Pseudomonadota bacterium]